MKSDKNTVVAENPEAEAAAVDAATICGPVVDMVYTI